MTNLRVYDYRVGTFPPGGPPEGGGNAPTTPPDHGKPTDPGKPDDTPGKGPQDKDPVQ